jgi:hypothetical protein
LHTILAQRLVLNIRKAAEPVPDETYPTIAFAIAAQHNGIEMDTLEESRGWLSAISGNETESSNKD